MKNTTDKHIQKFPILQGANYDKFLEEYSKDLEAKIWNEIKEKNPQTQNISTIFQSYIVSQKPNFFLEQNRITQIRTWTNLGRMHIHPS